MNELSAVTLRPVEGDIGFLSFVDRRSVDGIIDVTDHLEGLVVGKYQVGCVPSSGRRFGDHCCDRITRHACPALDKGVTPRDVPIGSWRRWHDHVGHVLRRDYQVDPFRLFGHVHVD
jgi:hypothetical protein